MTYRAILTVGSLLAMAAGGAAAQQIECGSTYTVVRGDTLSKIAERAYGDQKTYQLIYNANAQVIGRNPGIIEIGHVYSIPCLDAPLQASTADASVIRTAATTDRVAARDDGVISIVTATDWAPYLDEDQEQGGMLTEVVNVAMSKVRPKDGYKIDFVNDWGAHLQPLISDIHYDFSMAWFRPNCDKVEYLSDGSKFRCNNLDWSDALYQQIIGFYTRADYPAPLQATDMFGTHVCRPAGYSTFMMEEDQLMPPNITFSQPNGPTECFQGLLDGTYDMVVLAVDVSDDTIAKLGAQDQVVKHDALDKVATLHAVTSKNHPYGKEYLAVLDDGLKQIKDSGEWFSIVRRHLAEHKAKQ